MDLKANGPIWPIAATVALVVVLAAGLTWLAVSRPWEIDRCALTPEERNRAVAAWETRQLEEAGLSVGSSDNARTATAYEPLPPDTAFMLDLHGAAATEALRRPEGGIYVPAKPGCAHGTRI